MTIYDFKTVIFIPVKEEAKPAPAPPCTPRRNPISRGDPVLPTTPEGWKQYVKDNDLEMIC